MNNQTYDVIIVGGSYSGLAAAMALGRAHRHVLVIDGGLPCNRQTPYSHNFLTQDGQKPRHIAEIAKTQVAQYPTVDFLQAEAVSGSRIGEGFMIQTEQDLSYTSRKLIFAAGIKDLLPAIPGFAECWGISVLHCPYCHGYEVSHEPTGVLGNGDYGFEFSMLIANWTKDLTLFTNGISTLSPEQTRRLQTHNISIVENEIVKLDHENGQLRQLLFHDGFSGSITALYARCDFVQHCDIPKSMGCEMTNEGYLQVDALQKTNVPGVYACGDSTTRMRTVASAVATGTTAGMMLNKEFVLETF